jgi:type II secretory pathway pseudopilin PulG
MFKKLLLSNKNSGMTFIELIVVMGIFTAISATVLFNYRDFSDGVALQNLSQEIALQGKRAQTLSSQGRRPILSDAQIQNPLPPDWVSSYGLAFDKENFSKSFMFYFNSFDPEEGDNIARSLEMWDFASATYQGCGAQQESECLEEIRITDGSYIELICVDSEPQLDPDCLSNQTNKLYVSFTRPYLEAYILDEDLNPVSTGFVKVSSSDNTQKRYISFWTTGQISVN